jgi:cation diffusion facilitator CzcD-associated flavoprotein CzcO
MTAERVDVLVVGAGISGIAAGYHLSRECPGRSWVILEARSELGGTWSFFRYPGLRSDSDLYTLGYSFKPWPHPQAIADAPLILDYLREAAREHGIDQRIRFGQRVVGASWSSADAEWTVEVERVDSGERFHLRTGFLFMCSGYYDYQAGYRPDFLGQERFAGPVLHPQEWPDALDLEGRRVVVIGSGATAVTLVPALAQTAAHVTMLQRSPSYVVPMPREDPTARWLRLGLGERIAYDLLRWKNVGLHAWFYRTCRRHPERARRLIRRWQRRHLGADYPLSPDFDPTYGPWEQRVCMAADGDLFAALREKRASIVTGEIETFTERGIRLRSGAELPADLIVTATGLKLLLLGGIEVRVDGEAVSFARTFNYKGAMFSDVPNFALAIGYTNASWTLKAELICRYVCRLLEHMARTGAVQCTPRLRDPSVREEPFNDLASGYIQRALPSLPKLGSKPPWRLHQDYRRDRRMLLDEAVDDGVIELLPARIPASPAAPKGDANLR